MYTQAFERHYLAGKILRGSAIRILKMWSFLSSLAGDDVTLGVAEHVRRRFDISPLELEESMLMLQDPPPHVRYVRCSLSVSPPLPFLLGKFSIYYPAIALAGTGKHDPPTHLCSLPACWHELPPMPTT